MEDYNNLCPNCENVMKCIEITDDDYIYQCNKCKKTEKKEIRPLIKDIRAVFNLEIAIQ